MKIHELAKKTGLTAPTIRFYEQEGLLDARHVQRGDNNYRNYSEEAVEHLLLIKEVQDAGFTLAEFKELDEACHAADGLVAQKAATFLRRKIAAVGEKIAELERVQTYLMSKLAEMLQEENASAQVSATAPILAC
jgi:MerR family copper efflux transcriptional regulator